MSEFDPSVLQAVRGLYKVDENARALLDWAAQRGRHSTVMEIDYLDRQQLGIPSRKLVPLAKALQQAGCGKFIHGRHKYGSRFAWNCNSVKLGQAASVAAGGSVNSGHGGRGHSQVSGTPVDTNAPSTQGIRRLELTISEAKEALARSYGVSAANIEITVRG